MAKVEKNQEKAGVMYIGLMKEGGQKKLTKALKAMNVLADALPYGKDIDKAFGAVMTALETETVEEISAKALKKTRKKYGDLHCLREVEALTKAAINPKKAAIKKAVKKKATKKRVVVKVPLPKEELKKAAKAASTRKTAPKKAETGKKDPK